MADVWPRSCGRDGTIADVRGEGMGYIVFRGREPFDLIAHRLPSAIAENKIVVATLPYSRPAFPATPLKFGSCLLHIKPRTWQGSFCLRRKGRERSRMAEAVPIATDCVRRVSIFLWLPRRCLCRIAVHAELFPTRCTHRGRRDIAPRTFRRRCNRKSSHAVSKRKGPFDGFEV
jgi:hypothetical protein